jgi:ribosomal protein S18 acetylase RimI-like enzyme
VRPDGRCFLRRPDAVPDSADRDLYVTVDEADADARSICKRLGFVVDRRESIYTVSTDPILTGLRDVECPNGFLCVSADRVDQDRLRVLDDALRQDVPGTDGWRWGPDAFREETFSADFDPETYLVAVEQASGEYVAIGRVWNNASGPRLGLIAVLPPYRRRGLARALLARTFEVLHERGQTDVSTEVDDENVASTSLIRSLGARRTGGSVEYVRRAEAQRSQATS